MKVKLLQNIRAQIQAERELAQSVLNQVNSGKGLNDIADLLAENARTEPPPRGSGQAAFEYWHDFFVAHVSNFFPYRARSSPADLMSTVDEILQRPVLVCRR